MVQLSPRKGIVTSFVLCQGQADSGESCSVLQSGPTRSLVAKFPQHLVITCSMQISCCRRRMLQTRPQTGVCEPDVVAPKAPQNNPSYMFVRSADLPSDSLHQDLAWRAVIYMEDLKKPQNCQNWGVGACQGHYGILNLHTLMLLLIARTTFSDFSDQCHYC